MESPNEFAVGCAAAPDLVEPAIDSTLLSALMANSTDRIYFKDLESRFVRINQCKAQLLHLSDPSEAIGKTDEDFFPGDYGEDRRKDELEIISTGLPLINKEEREDWPDGRVTWASTSKMPLFNSAGKCVGTFGISRDITRMKRAEYAYRLVFARNPVPMFVCDPKSLRFLAVNEAMVHQYGLTEQEFLATTVAKICPGREAPHLVQDIDALAFGHNNRGIWRHSHKNGTIIDVEITCRPLEFGGAESILASAQDITERKRAEEAVRRAEEKYRGIFENAVIGIFQSKPGGSLVSVNPALAEMHGYGSPEEMLEDIAGAGSKLLVDPVQMVELTQEVEKDDRVHSTELEIYRKDRSRKWVRMSLRAVRDVDGMVVLREGTVEDVTERKLAEQKLQESESKYRALFEDSADATWLMDESGFFDCNSAALEMFGYPAGVIPTHPSEISPPNQPDGTPSEDAADQKIALAFKNGKERFEWWHKRMDGSLFPADIHLTAVKLNGRPALLGIIRDITEQTRAEEVLLLKNALLEAQAESTIDGILVVDDSDHIILANKQFCINLGIPEDLLSAGDDRAVREVVIGKVEDPSAFIERVNYLNNNRNETSTDELRFKNGQIFERYSAPLVDSRGGYRGRIWYFRDVTDRKRKEDVLRRLSSVVEQSPVSVVITDLQGDITYVNHKFTKTSGYEAGEVLGKNPRILKSGYSSPSDYQQLWETITAGEEWRGVFHNRKKNGDLYWESAVIRPLEDHDGTISHFLALKEDITDKLALEGQLRQSQKLEAIGQLAAGIAHEINTPIQYVGDNTSFFKDSWGNLSCLLTAAQKLRNEVPPDMVPAATLDDFDRCSRNADVEYLSRDIPLAIDQTLEGIERVTRIVRAMKEFSHPGTQDKCAIDLNRAIETTITISRNEWKYIANVETRLDPDLPLVPCLAGEINQVLLNLVVNGAHAIAEAAPHNGANMGTITLSTRRDGDWVEVGVADTGTGIPENVRERVFDPFFTTKEVGKGTGQGLMLAHTVIVKKHQGKIWFDSKVGKGTTFFLRLPLSSAPEN